MVPTARLERAHDPASYAGALSVELRGDGAVGRTRTGCLQLGELAFSLVNYGRMVTAGGIAPPASTVSAWRSAVELRGGCWAACPAWVRPEGLEPPRPCGHSALNAARLPVPPRAHAAPDRGLEPRFPDPESGGLPITPIGIVLTLQDSNLDDQGQNLAGCRLPQASSCGGGGTRTPERPSGPQPFSRRCPRPAGPPPGTEGAGNAPGAMGGTRTLVACLEGRCLQPLGHDGMGCAVRDSNPRSPP
jgi:hypothetical protein